MSNEIEDLLSSVSSVHGSGEAPKADINSLPKEVQLAMMANVFALQSACDLIEEMRGNKLGTGAYCLAGMLSAAWGRIEAMPPSKKESIGDELSQILDMTLQFKRRQ